MGVVRPLGASLVRVPRDSNRMSHPLAGAINHGGLTSQIGSNFPSALEQHGQEEGRSFTLSFIIVGKNIIIEFLIYSVWVLINRENFRY